MDRVGRCHSESRQLCARMLALAGKRGARWRFSFQPGRRTRLPLRARVAPFARWGPLVVIFGGFLVSDAACTPAGQSYRAGIQSASPTDRIRAIYKAGERRDPKAVALLVDRLEDEDEGVRLYAVLALEKITGKRFGYDYAAPPEARERAVDQWRAYVRDGLAAGNPAPSPAEVERQGTGETP